MGILSKIIAASVTTRIVKRLNQAGRDRAAAPLAKTGTPVPRQTYLPANPTLVDRAAQVYRDNPKIVAGVGVLIAAAALQSLTRKRY